MNNLHYNKYLGLCEKISIIPTNFSYTHGLAYVRKIGASLEENQVGALVISSPVVLPDVSLQRNQRTILCLAQMATEKHHYCSRNHFPVQVSEEVKLFFYQKIFYVFFKDVRRKMFICDVLKTCGATIKMLYSCPDDNIKGVVIVDVAPVSSEGCTLLKDVEIEEMIYGNKIPRIEPLSMKTSQCFNATPNSRSKLIRRLFGFLHQNLREIGMEQVYENDLQKTIVNSVTDANSLGFFSLVPSSGNANDRLCTGVFTNVSNEQKEFKERILVAKLRYIIECYGFHVVFAHTQAISQYSMMIFFNEKFHCVGKLFITFSGNHKFYFTSTLIDILSESNVYPLCTWEPSVLIVCLDCKSQRVNVDGCFCTKLVNAIKDTPYSVWKKNTMGVASRVKSPILIKIQQFEVKVMLRLDESETNLPIGNSALHTFEQVIKIYNMALQKIITKPAFFCSNHAAILDGNFERINKFGNLYECSGNNCKLAAETIMLN